MNAVRAYGSSLQAALEKSDAGALTLLQQTTQQQLLTDGDDILGWQVQQAQDDIDAANQTLALAQQKHTFNTTQSFMNAGEIVEASIDAAFILNYAIVALAEGIGASRRAHSEFSFGAAASAAHPRPWLNSEGRNITQLPPRERMSVRRLPPGWIKLLLLASKLGSYQRRQDNWNEAAAEAQIQITQAQAQLDHANLALQIAQQNQSLHQEQIDNIQKQIDFLNNKFTADSLYDWMAASLSATYFQSYQLAYQMCKQVERCYRFELGVEDSSFIQFG